MYNVQARAELVDKERKIRILKSQEIDVEKYLKASDVTHQVHEAGRYLEEIRNELQDPHHVEVNQTMPWQVSKASFRFRPVKLLCMPDLMVAESL